MSGTTNVLREPAPAYHHENAIENGRLNEKNSHLWDAILAMSWGCVGPTPNKQDPNPRL